MMTPGEGSPDAMENTNPEHTYIGMMAENLRILAGNLGGNPDLVKDLNTANVVGPKETPAPHRPSRIIRNNLMEPLLEVETWLWLSNSASVYKSRFDRPVSLIGRTVRER